MRSEKRGARVEGLCYKKGRDEPRWMRREKKGGRDEDGGIGLRWEGKECDESGDYEIG